MKREIEQEIQILEEKYTFIYDSISPILLTDLEAIVLIMLRIVILMLKRELKRLA